MALPWRRPRARRFENPSPLGHADVRLGVRVWLEERPHLCELRLQLRSLAAAEQRAGPKSARQRDALAVEL